MPYTPISVVLVFLFYSPQCWGALQYNPLCFHTSFPSIADNNTTGWFSLKDFKRIYTTHNCISAFKKAAVFSSAPLEGSMKHSIKHKLFCFWSNTSLLQVSFRPFLPQVRPASSWSWAQSGLINTAQSLAERNSKARWKARQTGEGWGKYIRI